MFKAYKIDPVFGELSLGTYSGGTGSVTTDKMVRIIFNKKFAICSLEVNLIKIVLSIF